MLLAKFKLNSIEVFIYKALVDSSIGHDELILINNVLKELYDMKEEIKIIITYKSLKLYKKKGCLIVRIVEKILNVHTL